jgi:hypothetical protein
MTPFSLLIGTAGLSHREAAAFLKVRLDTVHSWSSGRNNCRAEVLDELRDLVRKQDTAAKATLDQIKLTVAQQPDAKIELGYPSGDHEAQSLGWPCLGAYRAMAGRVIADLDIPISLIERGSSLATAAAIRAHSMPPPKAT